MKPKVEYSSPVLPGNTPGFLNPVVPIELVNTAPVEVVRIYSTYQAQMSDSISPDYTDTKEIDASKFPLLRGF